MTAHCKRCGHGVDLDLTLAPVPVVVLCPECKVLQDQRGEDQTATGDPGVEILELGVDEVVVGVDVTF